MKKVTVVGKTDVVINLNKIGVPIRGKVTAILNIANDDHMNELTGLVKAGLLDIIKVESSDDRPSFLDTLSSLTAKENTANPSATQDAETKTAEVKKNKGGRPKGSKNKPKGPVVKDALAKEEHCRVSAAESRTQQMRSRVVIGTLNGAKEGHMTRSAIDELPESERTQASLEAMEKLEREEKEDIILPDTKIDESKLDASEQMGRKAVISTQAGTEKVGLVNSILPEAAAVRDVDPFIDRKEKSEEKAQDKTKDAFVNTEKDNDDDDDVSDAFIKI